MNLVTDRVAGAIYNATDLNRVESAVAYFKGLLLDIGITADVDVSTVDWGVLSLPDETDMERYFANISILREALTLPADTPVAPSMTGFGYGEANDLEEILQILDTMIFNVKSAYRYSGMFASGQGGIR